MKNKSSDASLYCLLLVFVASIPVSVMRSKTYSLGYQIASLKLKEQQLEVLNKKTEEKIINLEKKISSIASLRAHEFTYPTSENVNFVYQEIMPSKNFNNKSKFQEVLDEQK